MPEQDNQIPEPISNARYALENLRAGAETIPTTLEKRIYAMAIRLDQTGQNISPENLQWHIMQGEEHIKNIGRTITDAEKKQKLTPAQRYKQIIETKTAKAPEPDLSQIKWTYEQAKVCIENKRYKELIICKSLIKGQCYDIIEALHNEGIIKTDTVPNSLLFAAIETDDVPTLRFIQKTNGNIFSENDISYSHAAQEGSLECLKYLLDQRAPTNNEDGTPSITDLCACAAYYSDHLHLYTYLNNNYDISEDMNIHIGLRALEKGHQDFAINAMDYLQRGDIGNQMLMGICSQHGNLELFKAIQDHFNLPAFTVFDEEEQKYPMETFIPFIIGNGHVDMARHVMKDAPELSLSTWEGALTLVSLTGKIDGMRYLVEDLNVLEKLDASEVEYNIYCAGKLQHWDATAYLSTQYLQHYQKTPNELDAEIPPLIEKWQKLLHMPPPAGLLNAIPEGLKTSTYNALQDVLSAEIDQNTNSKNEDDNDPADDDETEIDPIENMANHVFSFQMGIYKLARLFGTANRALDYLEKWGDFEKPKPFNNLADQLNIPLTENFNAKAWGDAVLKYGPEMGKLATYADTLPHPPSMTKSRRTLAAKILSRGAENPDFAAICIDLKVPEKEFNHSLDIWSELNRQGFPQKSLPDITIDGDTFDKPGTKFYLMKSDDMRGFILGHYLDCCQHVGHENGGMPTLHGMSSENGGFYCIEDENEKIIGAIWAWRGENGELVFDSLEHLKGHMNKEKWHKLLTEFTEKLESAPSDISNFLVAVDNNEKLAKGLYKEIGITATPKDYAKNHYRDSHRQYHVWTNKPEQLVIYDSAGEDDENEAFKNLVKRLFPDAIYAYEDDKAPPKDETPDKEQLNRTFFAYKNDDLIGFASIRHMESHEQKSGFYLEFLGVDPDKTRSMARYQVVAKLLEAIEIAITNSPRADKTVHFLTHADNFTVQKGVSTVGFEYYGREENFFVDGKAALAYAIDLSQNSLIHNIKKKRSHQMETVTIPATSPPQPAVQIWDPAP